ncbi:hypothetical protein GCM10009095_25180 [Sphingomonas molluscorum]|nr:hypothetical protein GCM10017606_29190 [Microbacterium terregens]
MSSVRAADEKLPASTTVANSASARALSVPASFASNAKILRVGRRYSSTPAPSIYAFN